MPGTRSRPRSSGAEAAAVRRLAARRAATRDPAAAPAQPGVPDPHPPVTGPPVTDPPISHPTVTESPEAADGTTRRARPFGRRAVLALLAAAMLVFGGLAAWFGTEAGNLATGPSTGNLALADPGATSQVSRQVASAIGALFSYDYANPAPTDQAAGRLLTGAAVKQYAALFAAVRQKAPKEKLVLTFTVSSAGVELLTPGTARVLVFGTQSDGSAGAASPTVTGAMLAVNAVRAGGTWKIGGIDTFTG